MKRPLSLILAGLLSSASLLAEEPAKPDAGARQLSSAGVRRALLNLETLKQNLKDTETNLENIKSNIRTLETEITTLDSLDNEQRTLKKKYEQFLALSSKENEKNEKALKDLEQFIRNAQQVMNREPNNVKVRAQLDDAERDRIQRRDWKATSAAKSNKLESLLAQINTGAEEIKIRRGQVKDQIRNWQTRTSEFEKIRADLQVKIRQTETLTKQNTASNQ